MDLQSLIGTGKEMGLEGKDLQEFVANQQAILRDERAKDREVQREREIREAEREREIREAERERDTREADLERERLALEKARLEQGLGGQGSERTAGDLCTQVFTPK